jgi:hypothetical protein
MPNWMATVSYLRNIFSILKELNFTQRKGLCRRVCHGLQNKGLQGKVINWAQEAKCFSQNCQMMSDKHIL